MGVHVYVFNRISLRDLKDISVQILQLISSGSFVVPVFMAPLLFPQILKQEFLFSLI